MGIKFPIFRRTLGVSGFLLGCFGPFDRRLFAPIVICQGVPRRLILALQAEGTCWCGVTEWQGQTAMRISVSSWATSDEDVEASLAAMLAVAAACGAQGRSEA